MSALAAAGALAPANAATQAQVSQAYGQLPLSFEANHGQTDAQVNFLARGSGYSLFLTPTQAMLDMQGEPGASASGGADTVLTMQLVGSNPAAQPVGLNQLPGVSNYYVGHDPSQWHTNIPSYAKVEYQNVYPGVNMVYYGNNQQHLEYDFVLAPGANPKSIQLSFQGAQGIDLDPQGDLVLHTSAGDVVEQVPVLYQNRNGVRHNVSGQYVLEGNGQVGFQVGFQVGAYDASRPLVIDPTYSLVYSTYLGGSGDDRAYAIAVDGAGNAYVTGTSNSTTFPALPLQPGIAGVFVTKFNANGSGLIYSTFLGSGAGSGIAVDSSGNAYVTGVTGSPAFPVLNAIQSTLSGVEDAFVLKLNATGGLVYSTYLGGSGVDQGTGIAIDGSGDAYVTGQTRSTNFPVTPGAFQRSFDAGGSVDGFVAKVNPSGSALVYATYLGGNNGTGPNAIAVDTFGDAYVTGKTESTFPTTATAFEPAFSGYGTAFMTKMNATGSGLLYSTYLGGSNNDVGTGIAVDSSGNAYVTGYTSSADFPTKNAFQTTFGGGSAYGDAFVAKLDPTQSGPASLVYSSYLGGSGIDIGQAIAVDGSGNAYVTGYTWSDDFPTANAFQPARAAGSDAFVTEITTHSGVAALVYSTYLGGMGIDSGQGIAVDTSGNAFVTGYTSSTTRSAPFPTTTGAFEPKPGPDRQYDAFVTKIDPPAAAAPSDPQGGISRRSMTSADRVPGVAASPVMAATPPLRGTAGLFPTLDFGIGNEPPAWQSGPPATIDSPGTDADSSAPFLPASWKDVRDVVFAALDSTPFADDAASMLVV